MGDLIQVISSAHTNDPRAWECLRKTSELHSVPLQMIGVGRTLSYPSNDKRLFLETVDEGIEAIEKSSADYIVCTDAFDVLVNRWDESELIEAISSADGLLVSCEANCFPGGSWKEVYDNDPKLSGPWRYANGGQFCGTKDRIISLLKAIKRSIPTVTVGGANEVLHNFYMEKYPFTLDWKCKIFQSMYTLASEHVQLRGGIACNMVHGTSPLFLHFNGRAPNMPRWFKDLTGLAYQPHPLRPEYQPC